VSSTERVQFFHISRPNWVNHAAEAVVFDMLLLLLANAQRGRGSSLVGAPFVACLVLLTWWCLWKLKLDEGSLKVWLSSDFVAAAPTGWVYGQRADSLLV
jgi:hypothetical protein